MLGFATGHLQGDQQSGGVDGQAINDSLGQRSGAVFFHAGLTVVNLYLVVELRVFLFQGLAGIAKFIYVKVSGDGVQNILAFPDSMFLLEVEYAADGQADEIAVLVGYE